MSLDLCVPIVSAKVVLTQLGEDTPTYQSFLDKYARFDVNHHLTEENLTKYVYIYIFFLPRLVTCMIVVQDGRNPVY